MNSDGIYILKQQDENDYDNYQDNNFFGLHIYLHCCMKVNIDIGELQTTSIDLEH